MCTLTGSRIYRKGAKDLFAGILKCKSLKYVDLRENYIRLPYTLNPAPCTLHPATLTLNPES